MSITLVASFVSAQEHLPDGSYQAETKVGGYRSSKVAFTKQGNAVTGYLYVWGPAYCFQGTFAADAIQATALRELKEDQIEGLQPAPYRLFPVPSNEEAMLAPIAITGAITSITRPVGVESRDIATGGPKPLSEREYQLLDGCVTYFATTTEPPCSDPELRATIPAPGKKPTYPPSRRAVCTITDEPQTISGIVVPGGVCSVDAVFEVMATTAVALAPFNDDEREQTVTDCGVLRLMWFLSPNPIRPQIDRENHRVTNSTLRGHAFYPGQVVREIVEYEGQVQVVTVGAGNPDPLTELANRLSGPHIWEKVDEELRRAFAKDVTFRTAEGYKRSELHDGTYRASEANRPVHGATLIFRKRGDSVLGTHATPYGVNCYQGTITPSEIHVGTNVVRRDEDYKTKSVTFVPVFDSDRDYFAPLRFIPSSIDPYPNPRALLGTIPSILARDTKWLNECSRHFGLPEKEPPRCGDSDLQDAVLSCEARSQYFRSEVACRSSKTCTAANVFAVMLKTPNAIATVGTTGGEAQDCGVLSVRVPGGGDARVRTEFDTKHNVIKIFTLPGHPFHPSTISRYVVDVGGRVDVNTEACGPDSVLAKIFADTSAAYVWEGPNKALKAALSGNPAPKKPNPATKKAGSATKKKP